MAALRKFDAEPREGAVRMSHEQLTDAQCSNVGGRTRVGGCLA
ncbi:hypothetical protein [Dietzia maris]|uniref:Uncharacterized protein n=1 Tax=Dietzia maris TaxID=37915 RepID=A0ABT8H5G5_9ACTN|nr:hypothetical protein [Dietzia maris]MDN4507712.1 hypothetical protein [Dietzia maris]